MGRPLWHCLGSSYWAWVALTAHRNMTSHSKDYGMTRDNVEEHISDGWHENMETNGSDTGFTPNMQECIYWLKECRMKCDTLKVLKTRSRNPTCTRRLLTNGLRYFSRRISAFLFSSPWPEKRWSGRLARTTYDEQYLRKELRALTLPLSTFRMSTIVKFIFCSDTLRHAWEDQSPITLRPQRLCRLQRH